MNEEAQANNHGDIGERVRKLGEDFRDMLGRDERYKEQLGATLRAIDEKASNAGRTDFSALGSWAAVIIAVIVATVGGMGYLESQLRETNQMWMMREMDHHWDAINRVNDKVDQTSPMPIPVKKKRTDRRMTAQEFLDQPEK